MKTNTHPAYGPVLYHCASCKTEWTSGSTKLDGPTRNIDDVEHHVISLEICSNCHPFYTGKKSFVDMTGRLEKFNKRFGTVQSKKAQKKAAAGAEKE